MSSIDQVLEPYGKVLFSGSPEQVHKWLEERPLFRDGVKVHVGKTMKIMGSGEYLDVKPPKSDGKIYTEDEVRAVVREEIKKVLGALAQEAAAASWSYPSDSALSDSLMSMYGIFFREIDLLEHDLECDKRKASAKSKCSCGMEIQT